MLSLLPKYRFPKLTDIAPDFCKTHNIELLLLDFDNTMLPYTTDHPSEALLQWIEKMRQADISLCIVSNSHNERVPRFSEKYGIPCVLRAAKPQIRGIRTALQRFRADKSKTALVGDQTYTDVLGANLSSVTAIQVQSINNHTIWLKMRHVLELPWIWMSSKRRVLT